MFGKLLWMERVIARITSGRGSEIGPTTGVSTYNETGLTTNREAPLDRCFVGKSLLGRATCELVDVDRDYEIGFGLTDHWAQRVDITL